MKQTIKAVGFRTKGCAPGPSCALLMIGFAVIFAEMELILASSLKEE
jgi:hypothetical protein